MSKDTDLKVREYRGVAVFLSGGTNPNFYAFLGGKHHSGGSFDTLRKKINTALTFEAFDALQISRDVVEQVRVIGVDMDDSNWLVDSGGHTHGGTRIKFYYQLYPLSMRHQLESFVGECETWDRIEEENKQARHNMREALEAKAVKRPDGA